MRVDGERKLAYGLLRVTLGIDFSGHGVARLLHGDGAFAAGMVTMMAETPLPAGLVYGFGLVVPWGELGLGRLLIAGVWTRGALVGGAVLMMALMLGITLKQDWETAGLQLGYAVVLAGLLFLRERYDAGWLEMLGWRASRGLSGRWALTYNGGEPSNYDGRTRRDSTGPDSSCCACS